jgi:histidine ammonia-lyase
MRGRRGARCAFLGVALFVLTVFIAPPAHASEAAGIELVGGQLTIEQVVEVARQQTLISVSSGTMERVDLGYNVVLEAALQNVPVYGLTVGVGLNKDRPIFKEVNGQRVLSEEVLDVSRQFNLNSLRSHAGATGEPISAEVVRAAMLIRLNTMLSGTCGAQRDVAQRYVDFLNRGIVPVVPSTGTVGEADITVASHIGLVMVGEWEAFYQGRRVSGAEALQAAGIQPLRPVGKDFLHHQQ